MPDNNRVVCDREIGNTSTILHQAVEFYSSDGFSPILKLSENISVFRKYM